MVATSAIRIAARHTATAKATGEEAISAAAARAVAWAADQAGADACLGPAICGWCCWR